MFKDILGFNDVIEKEYKSPFPKKNRLNLVIPKTTTKFAERSTKQYAEIASVCSDIANLIDGNSAVFFPSYELMLNISEQLLKQATKPIFIEKQSHGKKEKEEAARELANQRNPEYLREFFERGLKENSFQLCVA